MSFGNALMAAGAAAFVVPLVIHLFFRSRYRSLDWGAMFLLRDVVQANRRRMQWHQWILLLLRCAIPILLALAMARPLLSSVQSLAGKQPVSLILMIDDSRSMSAGSRSARTIASVTGLLDSMSNRDEIIVIPASQLAAPVATGSAQDGRLRLKEIRFDGGPAHFAAMLQSAASACREASHPYKRVVVVSDFQENMFRSASSTETDSPSPSFLGSIDAIAERFAQFDPRPQLDFLDIGEPDSDTESLANVVVESVQADVPAVLVDRSVPLTATVRNDSDLPVPGVRASWMVDGRVMETQTLSIEPRGTARLNWKTKFDRTGGASVGLSIEHTDAISADNRRELAIEVLQPIRVWLVDGEPSSEPLQSETDFLKVALSPFAFRATDRERRASANRSDSKPPDSKPDVRQRDLVSTKVISPKTLLKELTDLDLTETDTVPRAKGGKSKAGPSDFPDLIVLANVERPPGASTRSTATDGDDRDPISMYLAAGGHVLFFDGDQVNAEAWQSCDWLPAKLGEVAQAGSTPFRIEPPGARLAAWRSLGNSEDSLFDAVEVTRRRELNIDNSVSVLLRTDSGTPLVVAAAPGRKHGSTKENGNEIDSKDLRVKTGRVVQFAFPCDTAWSNLPLRPVYLPMIQQLVLDMVGSNHQGSDPPGTTFVVRPDRKREPSEATGSVWQVTAPDGRTQALSTPITQPLIYPNTARVGVYRFSEKGDAVEEQARRGVVRVIDVPASESVLRPVAPELLAECSQRLQASNYRDAAALVAAAQRERFGTEIWRPLLWLLLLVMIAEILWQQIGVTRSANHVMRSTPGATS